MAKIKIISNPYTREIKYLNYKDQTEQWEDIQDGNSNSKLREEESSRNFLPFKIREIINIIIAEYYIDGEQVEIVFEGTQDEYKEVEYVCKAVGVSDKVVLSKAQLFLENARDIFNPTKDIFDTVRPIIEKNIVEDENVSKDLGKVSDALKDIIPLCVFGNYSAGKSTFINALIGSEILPSGGDPVTAKVYKIERSKKEDTAKIQFECKGEKIELLFEGLEYRLLTGNETNELIQDIFAAIEKSKEQRMSSYMNIALDLINGYEGKDREDVVISNVIELEVPFSRNGILGTTYNNFVIFDTPGSNSESNNEHSKVLEEALEGFSNGIPVWVSTYETLDSTDNASLCEKILDIEALDKRFTMIVLNKADGTDLDEFNEQKEHEILEYSSVEKMYAAGIYFVSSIMGLGAKNDGKLVDKHCRRIYRSQQEMYSDPEDEDYATLFKYNIMPGQMKERAMRYCKTCSNVVYANSGLYCVEQEMERFASRHSAYNKCQMVYIFLKKVIEETSRKIVTQTESLRENREARKLELESTKVVLIDSLNQTAETAESEYDKDSKMFIESYIGSNLIFKYDVTRLEKIAEAIRNEYVLESLFEVHKKGYEESRSKILEHAKRNSMELLNRDGNLRDKVGKMKDDLVRDYTELQENQTIKMQAEREIDKETSDEIMRRVIEMYKQNVLISQELLNNVIRDYWQHKAQTLKDSLIDIITGTDALSSSQIEEISQVIMNYQPLIFGDDAASVFVKTRFLRGNVLGIRVIENEKLNLKKLINSYNERIQNAVGEMAAEINRSSYKCFGVWKENLTMLIEENITKYNPQLRDLTEKIKVETEKISELEADQEILQSSLGQMEELMAWKVLD